MIGLFWEQRTEHKCEQLEVAHMVADDHRYGLFWTRLFVFSAQILRVIGIDILVGRLTVKYHAHNNRGQPVWHFDQELSAAVLDRYFWIVTEIQQERGENQNKEACESNDESGNQQSKSAWVKFPSGPFLRIFPTEHEKDLIEHLVRISEAVSSHPRPLKRNESHNSIYDQNDSPPWDHPLSLACCLIVNRHVHSDFFQTHQIIIQWW